MLISYRNFLVIVTLWAVHVTFCSLAIADVYRPKRLYSFPYFESIYEDRSQVFTVVKDNAVKGKNPILLGYHRAEKKFSIPIPSSLTARLCATNSKGQLAIMRETTTGDCILSLVDSYSKSITDLINENVTSCICNPTSIDDKGRVTEAIIDPVNHTEFFRSYYDGKIQTLPFPDEYISSDTNAGGPPKLLTNEEDTVVLARDVGRIVTYDFVSKKFGLMTIKETESLLPGLKGALSYSYSVLSINGEGILFVVQVPGFDKLLYRIHPETRNVRLLPSSKADLYKYDLSERVPGVSGEDSTYFSLTCSIREKRYYSKVGYVDAVLPNGDLYSNGLFLKRINSKYNKPYCFNSDFSVDDTCKNLFEHTSRPDERYGLPDDTMLFPKKDPSQRYHECAFTVKLTRRDGKQFGVLSLLLEDQRGNKTAVSTNKDGVTSFRITVDTNNPCAGPSLQGPFGKKDLHADKKYIWAQHCV